ncbi:DUF350 domain-containing protein [Candidatus Venteria ishoeyi]|uniref:DUF350 domain-containing protein n=1 Tax=Candidatus Venteria ishoeyi TaxID=1899563 RepID=A0A1H6FHR7_9GAMM|nr:DUF350 domain-containing protein [Candidatus Venteria ishoeyi]MDM8546612.1 DUF350 domain-containing protein [Candidatus Venteria ishoeyi]SEH08919.1 Uncharacterised protein [Candidatus Venteria ishoeyi]
MTYLSLDESVLMYYLIDFVIVLSILTGFRFFSNLIASASLHERLAEDDNFALGISLAGAIISIAIMLMGAVSGQVAASPRQELVMMAAYGVFGILLMWLTRKLFDHVLFAKVSIHQLILSDNAAAGLVDAGNMIATAIIVRAVMMWVEEDSWLGFGIVLLGFALSQLIMYLATWYRRWVFMRRHPKRSLDQELETNNIALAIRFSGHRIGLALAITSTSSLVLYQSEQLAWALGLWLLVALALFVAQTLIAIAARFILLPGVNVGQEVTEQRNIAIGALEASIYMAVGLIFLGLLG